jgi:hypothetical protein
MSRIVKILLAINLIVLAVLAFVLSASDGRARQADSWPQATGRRLLCLSRASPGYQFRALH